MFIQQRQPVQSHLATRRGRFNGLPCAALDPSGCRVRHAWLELAYSHRSAIQVANSEMIPMPSIPNQNISTPDNPLPNHALGPIGSISVPPSGDFHSELSCTETGNRPSEGDWKTHWNHGIEWISPDQAFKVHLGGRIQLDSVLMHEHGNSLLDAGGPDGAKDLDALTFRRARLQATGTMYEMIDYLVEFDFVNSVSREASPAL